VDITPDSALLSVSPPVLTFASIPSPSIVTGPSTSKYPILVKSSVIAADPCANQ
jgi:hypothetical protein